MRPTHIICHYGELALKGGNRIFFEKKLIENLQKKLSDFSPTIVKKIHRQYGRIVIELNPISFDDLEKIQKNLTQVFGLVYFSWAFSSLAEIKEIKKTALKILQKQDFENFRITTKRSNKNFPLTSEQINREVGAYIFQKLSKKVQLKNPQKNCFIEITEKDIFIYTEKIPAGGGLPVGTAGKALALLSGGLDSPVSAYYGLKRGLNVNFIHFHSMPYTSKASLEKVLSLAKKLKNFQAGNKLFSVSFADAQKEIMLNCPESLRIILYRRMMFKISEAVARKNKILALITGDSLGQVASQTLENLSVVGQATNLLILRPLIGMDKEEIMQKARQIETYDISILPHDDCCTRLMPKKPEIRAKLENVLEAEKNLNLKKIIQETLIRMEIISF